MRASFSSLEMSVPGTSIIGIGPDRAEIKQGSREGCGAPRDPQWHGIRRGGPEGVYVQHSAPRGVGSWASPLDLIESGRDSS